MAMTEPLTTRRVSFSPPTIGMEGVTTLPWTAYCYLTDFGSLYQIKLPSTAKTASVANEITRTGSADGKAAVRRLRPRRTLVDALEALLQHDGARCSAVTAGIGLNGATVVGLATCQPKHVIL
eukprot:jgi/Chlat1/7677/Chrsp64S07173